MVEGHLAWHEHKTDEMLDWFAWFTANQMVSTGNFKKGTKTDRVKESLFVSAEQHRKDAQITKQDQVKDAQEEKEKLMKRFNLTEEQLNS